jgi:hypothetical protein
MRRIVETGLPKNFDLTPYAGRWIAIVRGVVTGVGTSADAARQASKYQRPKEEPQVIFVPVELAQKEE